MFVSLSVLGRGKWVARCACGDCAILLTKYAQLYTRLLLHWRRRALLLPLVLPTLRLKPLLSPRHSGVLLLRGRMTVRLAVQVSQASHLKMTLFL